MNKAEFSRARGKHTYVVFTSTGEHHSSPVGRLWSKAHDEAKRIGGEVWLAGKCVGSYRSAGRESLTKCPICMGTGEQLYRRHTRSGVQQYGKPCKCTEA